MSSATSTPSTFLRQPPAFPFCPGCGYRPYVEHLDRALVALGLDPSKVAIVSDVGCIGAMCDVLAAPHVVRALDGRSTALAAGLELADAILHDSTLKTIVVVGDGGAMGGLQHILSAGLMNLDLTVLVANNGVLGLAGGQPSALSAGNVDAGSPGGLVPTLDLCGLVRQCGGGFVARLAATDQVLSNTIARAIAYPGFALVEVLIGCPAYGEGAARAPDWSHLPLGCWTPDVTRPDFGVSYRQRLLPPSSGETAGTLVPQLLGSPVRRTLRWVIAGSAGEQVHWAAGILAQAAVMTGSHVTLSNLGGPLPGTGLAMSEVCVSRDPIGYTGVDAPDVVVAVSQDAVDELGASGILARLTKAGLLVVDESLSPVETDADTVRAPFRAAFTPARAAMAAVLLANRRQRSIADQAVFAAIRHDRAGEVGRYRKDLAQLLESLA